MSEYTQAFLLGNGAILGNVCILPLYPGFIGFLGGVTGAGLVARVRPFLGLVVFAGMMTVMLSLGWVLFELNRTFSSICTWFLPLVFGIVIVLGIAMLFGRNPFARMSTMQAPVVGGPVPTAWMVLGPMTLPCTEPLIVSAFVLGIGDWSSLLDGMLYFVAFGLGFGWPLVILPLVALQRQRSIDPALRGRGTALGGVPDLRGRLRVLGGCSPVAVANRPVPLRGTGLEL